MPAQKIKAAFTEPMLLLPARELPEGPNWAYELKLDGYRTLAIKTGGRVQLRSRNNKDFNARYPAVSKALSALPDESMIDSEIVALDESGRPSFNLLQNYGASTAPVVYYVFDVLVLNGRDVMSEPLSVRRELLRTQILPKLGEPVRHCPELNASLAQVIESVRGGGSGGFRGQAPEQPVRARPPVGRLAQDAAQPRAGVRHRRVHLGGKTFDALVFGYYEGDRLVCVGRTRSGFTPALRGQLWQRFRGLEIAECPFANLPEARSGRWGEGLTADKMKECRWLKPVLVGQFEFVEWTPDGHLRHASFIALREDRDAWDVGREG
jgi:bifunctional non-homologous end joining protein LigD